MQDIAISVKFISFNRNLMKMQLKLKYRQISAAKRARHIFTWNIGTFSLEILAHSHLKIWHCSQLKLKARHNIKFPILTN